MFFYQTIEPRVLGRARALMVILAQQAACACRWGALCRAGWGRSACSRMLRRGPEARPCQRARPDGGAPARRHPAGQEHVLRVVVRRALAAPVLCVRRAADALHGRLRRQHARLPGAPGLRAPISHAGNPFSCRRLPHRTPPAPASLPSPSLARYPTLLLPHPTLATARAQNNTNGQMMINNCTSLTVTGATLYYVTPPFTQATIVDISPDQLTWTVQARLPNPSRRPAGCRSAVRPHPMRAAGTLAHSLGVAAETTPAPQSAAGGAISAVAVRSWTRAPWSPHPQAHC